MQGGVDSKSHSDQQRHWTHSLHPLTVARTQSSGLQSRQARMTEAQTSGGRGEIHQEENTWREEEAAGCREGVLPSLSDGSALTAVVWSLPRPSLLTS